MNCLDKDDRVLVIDGGSFGHRFVELCRLHQIPCEVLELKFGDALTAERLQAYDGKGFTALLVNIHETSTGQLYDGKMLSEFCRKNNMYFIVDAISSFLADPISVREWGIDVLILSSQKGLALPPGLSAIVLSGRMMKRTETASRCLRIQSPHIFNVSIVVFTLQHHIDERKLIYEHWIRAFFAAFLFFKAKPQVHLVSFLILIAQPLVLSVSKQLPADIL